MYFKPGRKPVSIEEMDAGVKKTVEDLKKRRIEALERSKQALLAHPRACREIKNLVRRVAFQTVDIGEYFAMASRLSDLLRTMTGVATGTLFAYFLQHIDPKQYGEARYFRGICLDLLGQIEELDRWRANRRNLSIVK